MKRKMIFKWCLCSVLLTAMTGMFTSCEEKEGYLTGNGEKPAVETQPEVFEWNGATVALDKPEGWGITVLAESVLLTNAVEQKQYVLRWQGGLTPGDKENPVLELAEGEVLPLVRLKVNVEKGYCTIDFASDTQSGVVKFNK